MLPPDLFDVWCSKRELETLRLIDVHCNYIYPDFLLFRCSRFELNLPFITVNATNRDSELKSMHSILSHHCYSLTAFSANFRLCSHTDRSLERLSFSWKNFLSWTTWAFYPITLAIYLAKSQTCWQCLVVISLICPKEAGFPAVDLAVSIDARRRFALPDFCDFHLLNKRTVLGVRPKCGCLPFS